MKKLTLFITALIGSGALACAGSLKTDYNNTLTATDTQAIEMPAEQLNMSAEDVASANMAMFDTANIDQALSLVNTWNKDLLAIDIMEKDNTMQMYIEPTGNDQVECVLVIRQSEEPQLIMMYLEGSKKILNSVSVMN